MLNFLIEHLLDLFRNHVSEVDIPTVLTAQKCELLLDRWLIDTCHAELSKITFKLRAAVIQILLLTWLHFFNVLLYLCCKAESFRVMR